MDKLVPLISSDVAGPLGVIHLPRLWLKVLLSAKGMLPDDYDECGSGFDQMTLDGLGLDREATLQYLKQNLPSYPQFEQWVVQQKGGQIDPATIERINASIRGYNHSDEQGREMRAAAGIESRTDIRDAVTLNKLEDWTEFHQALVGR
jgi:hypothetical protein